MGETVDQFLKRFWKNVCKDKDSGCWIWEGCKNCGGYGTFSVNNGLQLAHRISYYIHYKELPKFPYCVLHKCNNPSCVNPDHLYKGTNKDNKRDQIEKDGLRSGGQQKKLSEEDIQAVKYLAAEGMFQRNIAKIFNVSQWNIWNILNNIERADIHD